MFTESFFFPEPEESKSEEGMGLEAAELARWTRFAAKGGIGKCTATCDCVAESTDDLMFLKVLFSLTFFAIDGLYVWIQDDEITVLLQLPDRENLFLVCMSCFSCRLCCLILSQGYCEGVVGHFSGSDVHFHAKLKVPVKAKRASTIEKSSPPSSDITSSNGQPSSRRSSTSKTEADALDRRASQQRRVLISSRMQSMEDEQQRYPPSLIFSSSSTGTDSVVTTPALGYFSSPEIKKSSINGTPASSPRDPHFSIEAPQSKSMPPTRTSSPPAISHSHAAMVPTVHRMNSHTFNLMPESTTPLRINKRTPISPSVPQFSPNPSQSASQPPLSVPDTSYSSCKERSNPRGVGMSDVEVGIGLSLLQDLANGIDSDSDDSDDQWPKSGSAAGTPDLYPYAAALSRVGHRRDSFGDRTQESTVEGLGYTLSEDDHEKREPAGTGKHPVIVENTSSQTTSAVTTRRASPNLSIYSNSNASTGRSPNIFLPSSTSPISPSFSQSSSTDERRPSLAPSASSASEWEGASDIYDDYRYSRYSMASKMSRFSSSAGWTGSVPLTPPLPDSSSIGRARTDSNKSRPDSCARSRTDSMNTRSNVDSSSTSSEMKAVAGGSLLSSPPLFAESSDMGGQEPQGSQQQDDLHSKRTTIMKERTMSMESAASVYTQNSCLSTLSQEAISPGTNVNNHFDTPSTFSNANGKTSGAKSTRPTPLSLSQSDVVKSLHTTWGTPLSSAIERPSSAGTESSDLHTPMVGVVGGGSRAGVGTPLGLTEEGRRKGSSDTMITGSFGHGVNGVGIASALRQRLETERQTPTPEQTQNQRLLRDSSVRKSFTQSDGLGHRIVVEDDDELPSRILDNSGSTFMTTSPEPMYDEDEEKDINVDSAAGVHDRRYNSFSPDPELMMLRTHLTPLTIANRTPSPSAFEGGSDDARGSRRTVEIEDEEQEQEREDGIAKEAPSPSPIIPTPPPLNGSSTPPPPQASISSSPPHNPALPRLSSSSTIRIGSPPIDFRPPLALSDIREPGGPFLPGSKQRQSLFLPHPNAPKSLGDGVVSNTGLAGPDPGVPMYIAAQQQGGWAKGPGGIMPPARPNVIGVIRMALNAPPRVAMVKSGQGEQGSSGQRSPLMMSMRGPTIYGRTEADLTGSLVPVPIVFSIDPPHVVPHPSNPSPTYLAPPLQSTPTSKPAVSSPPRSPMQLTTKQQQQSEPQQQRCLSLGTPAGARAATVVDASVSNAGSSAGEGDVTPAESKAEGPIPRPNFSPKSPTMRPRSRSFSCSTNAEVPQQR